MDKKEGIIFGSSLLLLLFLLGFCLQLLPVTSGFENTRQNNGKNTFSFLFVSQINNITHSLHFSFPFNVKKSTVKWAIPFFNSQVQIPAMFHFLWIMPIIIRIKLMKLKLYTFFDYREIMHAMWKPQKFKCIYLIATLYVFTLTLPSASAVYWAFGDELLNHSNAFSLLPKNGWRDAAVILMLIHQVYIYSLTHLLLLVTGRFIIKLIFFIS